MTLLTRSYIGSICGPNLTQEYSVGDGGDRFTAHSTVTDFPYGAYLVFTDGAPASDGIAVRGNEKPISEISYS